MRNRLRNIWRVLAFDIVAPLALIGGLLLIGAFLDWPVWSVSLFSALCLLIAEGMAVNFWSARRGSVTVGTDDHGPGLRLAVVGLATATLVAAVVVGYVRWTVPDRTADTDTGEVVRLATSAAEATATFSPQDPRAAIDRIAALMSAQQAEAYKNTFGTAAAGLAAKNISSLANTVSAGVEQQSADAASVAVIIRATRTSPGSPPEPMVVPLRVTLTKNHGKWQVFDVTPINPTLPQAESAQSAELRGDQSDQRGGQTADQSDHH
jgi:hypothetical protein